jgi:hypothetical protein
LNSPVISGIIPAYDVSLGGIGSVVNIPLPTP